MSSPLGSRYSEYGIPSIVITPALPSPESLPVDMRRALDSILSRRPSESSTTAVEHGNAPANHTAIGRPDVPAEDDTEDTGHEEVSHAPFNTQSGTTDNHFLLQLDFENPRISFGDVLAAINATRSDAVDLETVTNEATATDSASSTPRSRSPSPWDSDYVVITEPISRNGSVDASQEVAKDSQVVWRPEPQSGIVPPVWRHAMYISTLVWPAQTLHLNNRGSRDKLLPPVASPPKASWPGASVLARAFSLKRS
ncbi:hypothetical protein DICSQDRAFT_174197 [Dichomitus squalens LYAD-421 SS1]|uniref:Uncharacterized protein n=1 Tax=Dichomitus squalens (strain LYAD-421) TaxID=732165 RepID=R7SLW2_DICSQ|nr:uncharacterized protein DICSQDRAFT_174197 [Dichomitus squalens LYAD-421 SS1]EJF57136.1 hypothetical protein DICSQDRAFT_174197 [Dichomitus squalens LYAD-421 SS1]